MKEISFETKKIAEILKKKRLNLNISQLKLSKLSNVSQSIINKIENKKIEPLYSTVKKIENTLNLLEKENNKAVKHYKSEIVFIDYDSSLQEALNVMVENDFSQLIVKKNNSYYVLYMNSILKLIQKDKSLKNLKVKDYCKSIPIIVDESITVSEAKKILEVFPFLLTKKNNNINGILTKSDLFLKE